MLGNGSISTHADSGLAQRESSCAVRVCTNAVFFDSGIDTVPAPHINVEKRVPKNSLGRILLLGDVFGSLSLISAAREEKWRCECSSINSNICWSWSVLPKTKIKNSYRKVYFRSYIIPVTQKTCRLFFELFFHMPQDKSPISFNNCRMELLQHHIFSGEESIMGSQYIPF